MSTPTNWDKIRNEYFVKGTPLRELAKKYGVNERTLFRHAKKEGWAAHRGSSVNEAVSKCQQRYISASLEQVDRLMSDTELLLKKAEQLLFLEDALSPRDLKALSGTLTEVKSLLGIRDETDREEQRARIEKMRAEVKAMNEEKAAENKIEVVWVNNAWDEVEDETGAGQAK